MLLLLFLSLFQGIHGLFWDLLNCPLCYLPRVEWGTPYYPPAAPAYTPIVQPVAAPAAPVVAQPVRQIVQQPVQQVQYVYKRPIVKYIQPVRYVYLPQQQQQVVVQGAGGGGGGYQTGRGSYLTQTPRPPYKLTETELANRGYGTGNYNNYATGSSAVFETDDDAVMAAPMAHKLPFSYGRSAKHGKGKGRKPAITTPKPDETDDLVEFEDSQNSKNGEKPKVDISARKNTFHIHEDIEGAGKQPDKPKSKSSGASSGVDDDLDDLDDLDILTTDDSTKANKKGGVKESGLSDTNDGKDPEMIAIDEKKSKTEEMVAIIPKTQARNDEFIPIGTDKKPSKLSRMQPADVPPKLKKHYKAQVDMSNELAEAWKEKKRAEKPENPFI